MKTLAQILQLSTNYLKKCGIENSRYQAEEVLSSLLSISRMDLYMQFDRPLMEQELELLRKGIQRRGKREPWQYIAGQIDFYDCKILVNPSVLIPRQETEILIDFIDKSLPKKPLIVWDLCTGSGCIAIGLKKKRPELSITASDQSLEALALAQSNAKLNKVDIEFLQGDLLNPFHGRQADIVICNPPYVSLKDYENLDREVRDWEPYQALVPGPTGFEIYERLNKELPTFLYPQASVYLEIGTQMGNKIKNLFNQPSWVNKKIFQDWASHDRYVLLQT